MSWTEDFFGDYYLKIHLPLLTDDLNSTEVNFIEDILKLPPGAAILDMPCGFGRHSNILAARGYQVTGLDNKEEFINLARENSGEMKNVKYIQGDMRKIEFENEFDAVLNMFTSFGYFSDEENIETLKGISRALKKGGKVLIDMINREWALSQTKENGLVWLLYPDNKVFLANNKFNILTGRWISEQIIVDKGQSYKQRQDVRLYTFTELNFFLQQFGLQITDTYGDSNNKEPYMTTSRNMIVVAEKIQ
jgi:SAM-dependent methyltransferase